MASLLQGPAMTTKPAFESVAAEVDATVGPADRGAVVEVFVAWSIVILVSAVYACEVCKGSASRWAKGML